MAIFTKSANYLKCRNYYENILGFELVDNYTDEDYNNFGFLCSDNNLRIAQNIWFLYGGAMPWTTYEDYGELNPPLEIEDGFVIREIEDFNTNDKCGFILDKNGLNISISEQYFIGMKRLVPLENNELSVENSTVYDKNTVKRMFKNVVKFSSDEYSDIKPVTNELNEKQPNILNITTSYDYGDFGFKQQNKEFDVRQIGMLNHLCCPGNQYPNIYKYSMLFSTSSLRLASLFNISLDSNILPEDFDPSDFGTNDGDRTKIVSNGFFGLLQFYLNSKANNRITYQTDYYTFKLIFENKLKCSCTCDDCNCND